MSRDQKVVQNELEAEIRGLREQLDFLHTILDSTDDVVFAKDREGRHWLANRSAARVMGQELAEVLGRTTAELFPAEIAAQIEASDRQVLEQESAMLLEQEFVLEGSRRTYLTKKTPYRDGRGEVVGLVGISRDITQRKRAEEALQRQSAVLAERVKELQCLYSLSTVMGSPELSVEQKLSRVAELIPVGWRYPEVAAACITVGDTRYTCSGYRDTPWRLSVPLTRRDAPVGSVSVVYLEEKPVVGEGPFLLEERILLEEVAKRVEELLERRQVAEELTRARERAEAASRLKSQFVSNISHELRTPMNSILGFCELLIDEVEGPLNREQHGSLHRIDRNARKLLALINEVLDLSRIESAQVALAREPFSLREVVADVARDLGVLADRKGLRLEHRVDASVPDRLTGDSGRLRQVLINLGDNAIKFTDRGEVRLAVEPGEGCAPGEAELLFHVSDTGIGVPEQYHRGVFEAFVQVDGSLTRPHGGAGLGLAICSHLVQQMGGRIWVESGKGTGSTFHFTARLGLEDS